MRHQATNNQLLALEADIQRLSNESPAFFFFNKEKLRRFYQQNNMNLKIIKDRMNGFVKKYVKHENDEPLTEEKDGNKIYVFASEADEQAYRDETTQFLSRTITIEL